MDKWTKRWAGIPRSATNAVIHLKEGLDIPSISDMYIEAHNTSHARTRLQGDVNVNHVIDQTLQREERYSRMQCTTTQAENMYRETLHLNTLQGEIPTFTGEKAKQLQYGFNKEIRKQVKNRTRNSAQEKHLEHVKGHQVQGIFLTIAAEEKQDILWKSSMFQL